MSDAAEGCELGAGGGGSQGLEGVAGKAPWADI